MRSSVPNLSGGSVSRLVKTYDLVVLIALLWFMVQFLRFVFPPLFGTLQNVYDVSNTQTGLLFTLLMFGYSAMQFPGGLLSDRFHEATVIVGGAGFFTIAALSVFVAPTFELVTLAAVGIGLGTGVHKTVAIAYLSRVYPDRTGLSLGIMDTVGQFGGMLAPIVVVGLLGWGLPWGSVFLVGAATSALFAVALYIRAKPQADNEPTRVALTPPASTDTDDQLIESDESKQQTTVKTHSTESDHSYVTIFTDPKLVVFLCVTVLFTFSWNGLSAFFPLFLTDAKGISPSTAGFAYSLLFAASLSQTITGWASDRVGKLTISIVLFGVMISGLIALLVSESIFVILGLTILTGIGFHGFRPVRDSYLMDLIPSSIGGGTLGIVRTFMTAIGGAAPLIIGFLSDIFSYTVAFGLIVGMLVVGALFITILH